MTSKREGEKLCILRRYKEGRRNEALQKQTHRNKLKMEMK